MYQGKSGPHGDLFCFLIQKEPATVSGSETFSPFFKADVRTPSSLLVSLKKYALIAIHVIAEEGRDGEGCYVAGLER